jgi:hypothetical protein
MSTEVIKWAELTPEQRDELMAEKVLGYSLADARGNIDIPHYTTSLDAVWLLCPKLLGASYVVQSKFLCAYKEDDDPERYEWTRYITYEFIELHYIQHMTPERICIAILRAFGYIVLTEE